MTQRSTLIALTLITLILLPGQAPAKDKDPDPKNVVVTVNGVPIREKSVQRGLRNVPISYHETRRGEIVDALIEQTLLDQYLKKTGVQVQAKEVDQRFTKMTTLLKKQKQDYKEVLARMMLSEKELRDHIQADLRWEKYSKKYRTDQAARKYFNDHKETFDGTMVQARHLLIRPKDDAHAFAQAKAKLLLIKQKIDTKVAEAIKKLPKGTDKLTRQKAFNLAIEDAFSEQAKQSSDCPSKLTGGDVGWFHRAGTMVEPFAKTAFGLKTYEMSSIVQTRYGLHLILVTGRNKGRDVKYDEVKEQVQAKYEDYLRAVITAQLRKKAKIVHSK